MQANCNYVALDLNFLFVFLFLIRRIQAQVEQLEREYRVHALGALKSAPLRGSGKVTNYITN